MIEIALIIYAAIAAAALILYFPHICGFFYAFKKLPHRYAYESRKIAVLIPARNESAVIGDLLASLKAQDYENFVPFIIVQNQEDPTVALAKQQQINVIVVKEQHCKGDALAGFFNALKKDTFASFDAFVIVDADGVLSPSYLRELNHALEYDADIFITRKWAKNFLGGKENRSIFSNCSALTWPMLDDLGNAFRTALHMPLNLCGQGLMVRRKVIEEIGGWKYRTLTEDFELKLDGMLRGFRFLYYPYAVLYTEEALSHRESFSRRVRWLAGYRQSSRKYKKEIWKKVKSQKRMTRGEVEFFFGILPYVLFLIATAGVALCGIVLSIYYGAAGDGLWVRALCLLVVLPLSILYLLLHLFTVLALLCARDEFSAITAWERLSVAFFNPLYILEYLLAYFCAVFKKKPPAWKPTERIMQNKNTGKRGS